MKAKSNVIKGNFDYLNQLHDSIYESNLTAYAKLVLLTLHRYMDKDGTCRISYPRLLKHTSLSRSTLNRVLKELTMEGFDHDAPPKLNRKKEKVEVNKTVWLHRKKGYITAGGVNVVSDYQLNFKALDMATERGKPVKFKQEKPEVKNEPMNEPMPAYMKYAPVDKPATNPSQMKDINTLLPRSRKEIHHA